MPGWEQATKRLGERLERVFARIAQELTDLESTRALDRRPAPGAWTPREVAEHVTLTDRFLLILAEKIAAKSTRRLEAGGVPADAPASTEHLEQLAQRAFRWSHPEHMTPSGQVAIDELRSRLAMDCARACELLARMPSGEGSLHRIRMSVVGGEDRLDLYQYLTIVALHAERHLRQMGARTAPSD